MAGIGQLTHVVRCTVAMRRGVSQIHALFICEVSRDDPNKYIASEKSMRGVVLGLDILLLRTTKINFC